MKSQERHNFINETYFNESIYLPLGQTISIYACPGGTADAGDMEMEVAAHSSILAWESPWTEEPGGLQSMGSQRVGQDCILSTNTITKYTRNFINQVLQIQNLETRG